MIYFVTLGSFCGLCLLIIAVYMAWPSHPEHAYARGEDRGELVPLPGPERYAERFPELSRRHDLPELAAVDLGAWRTIRHPCYRYAANLAAMSWQSHKTLQRNYDMLAFATVAQAHYRMRARYA